MIGSPLPLPKASGILPDMWVGFCGKNPQTLVGPLPASGDGLAISFPR